MSSDKVSILVVDDLPDKLLVLETILEDLGEEIVTARSGEEALRHVLHQEFAVILMDVEMPGMDGIETAAMIRQRRKSAKTPIIFVTAYADDLRTSQGYSLGAVDYMLSPVVPEILRTKVKVFVDLHRMARDLRRHAEERVALAREQAARETAERAAAAIRASEERFRLASEAVNGFIYEVDVPSGRFVASPGLVDLLGFAPSEAGTLSWWDARIHPDDVQSVVAARSRTAGPGRQTYRVQYRVRHWDDHLVFVWDQGLVVRDATGEVVRLVGNVFDVTEQKRVEQALAEANRRKDEFLSMLAHELRNPLAPIRNAVALMRLQSARSPEFTGVCELLDRNVLQLVRLVDDLLDVSRISHGKIRVERNQVDIRAVIEQAVEISKPLLDARSHRLTVHGMEAPVRVLGDLTRLTQVVANLLNNAAKYTDPGGQVAVYVDRVDAEAVIRVRDTGIGLPADKLESVFEPFTQMEPTRERSEGGLGIGLTLARRLVELHGGRLSASSEGPGLGSEFTVRLPMASNAATPDPEAPAASQTPRRVLVADDNVDAAEKLARLVRGQGHEVRVAHNGPAALKAADSFQPELIVLDVGLPEMNGYEVARRLRRQPGLAAATLVAISTNGQCDDGSRCRDAGFDRHLVKPVDAEAIRLVLAHVGQQD